MPCFSPEDFELEKTNLMAETQTERERVPALVDAEIGQEDLAHREIKQVL